MKKKEVPFNIIQQINHFKTKYPDVCRIVKDNESIIKYIDADPESDFYFKIRNYTTSGGKVEYSISYKPVSENDLSSTSKTVVFDVVTSKLENWGAIIRKYNETDFLIEDPIFKTYTDEFYTEFKILDEDADESPFKLREQLIIDAYLDKSITYLTSNFSDDEEIKECIKIASDLKYELVRLTKNEVMYKLCQFWSKIRRKSITILKEIFFEFAKELTKELGKKLIGL